MRTATTMKTSTPPALLLLPLALPLALALVALTACTEPDYSAEEGSEPTPATSADVYTAGADPSPEVQVAEFPEEPPRGRQVTVEQITHPQTREETKTCVLYLVFALMAYKETNGDFPTEEEGLDALSTPPERHIDTWGWGDGPERRYAPQGMVDMWGRPYQYTRLDDPEEPFEVRSLGADGIPNADDITARDDVRKIVAAFAAAEGEGLRDMLMEGAGG